MSIYFIQYLQKILAQMTHNVLGVNDVWAARIGKRKGVQFILTPPLRLQGGPNVGVVSRGSETT
jgi:hypothetical protein